MTICKFVLNIIGLKYLYFVYRRFWGKMKMFFCKYFDYYFICPPVLTLWVKNCIWRFLSEGWQEKAVHNSKMRRLVRFFTEASRNKAVHNSKMRRFVRFFTEASRNKAVHNSDNESFVRFFTGASRNKAVHNSKMRRLVRFFTGAGVSHLKKVMYTQIKAPLYPSSTKNGSLDTMQKQKILRAGLKEFPDSY